MAVPVVEQLEVIDVHGHDRDSVGGSAAAGQQPAVLVEVAAVRELGQLVGSGFRLGGLERVDAGQGRGRFECRAVQQSHGRLGPDLAGPA